MEEKRETVGKIASELAQKTPDSIDPIEIAKTIAPEQEYIDNLIECVETHKKDYQGDFFVVVLLKKEKVLENVLRSYFFARGTCPTPNYDQSVFKYNHEKEQIEYIWTIPDRETCHVLMENPLQVADAEKESLKFVIDFADGTLYKLCRKLNGEDDPKGNKCLII